MVFVAAEKVEGDFPGYRGGDKPKRVCDESIVDSKLETQHEEQQPSEVGGSNVVGYSDL